MSSEASPESITTLSEDDRTDLSNIIYEEVLGEVPTSNFLDALIEEEPELIEEGIEWGFGDTVVRGKVASRCSEMLIARRWPIYGDHWTDEQMETFMKDLKNSYDEWNTKNSK